VTEADRVPAVLFREVVMKVETAAEAEADTLQTVHSQGVVKAVEAEVAEMVHRNLTEEVEINFNMCLLLRS
jgi:hypothetical protein